MKKRIPHILVGLAMILAFLLPQGAIVTFAASDNTVQVKGYIYSSGGSGGETPGPTPGGGETPDPAPGVSMPSDPTPGGGETSDPAPGISMPPDPTPGGDTTHTPEGTTGPRTGDNFNVDLYIFLLVGSILLLLVLFATRCKEDEESQTES